MLELSKEIIANVILKAKVFHAQENVVIPEDGSDVITNDILQILANHSNDPAYRELVNLQRFPLKHYAMGVIRGRIVILPLIASKNPRFLRRIQTRKLFPLLQRELLVNLINDLEPDQQEVLITLMLLGRRDYSINELDTAKQIARNIPIPNRADYLIAKPHLADYLEESLTMMNHE